MSVTILVPMVLLILSFYFSWKSRKGISYTAQRSPYECGFCPFQSARQPFSVYYFLMAIIFVVFDIELVVLSSLPMVGHLTCYGGGCVFGFVIFLL